MNEARCSNPECTIAQTGICVSNLTVELCPHVVREEGEEAQHETDVELGNPVLQAPTEAPRFPPSAPLGMEDVRRRRRSSYGSIVGVLGAPDSGKTACLVSLYLLLAHDRLEAFSYADSDSLVAFDLLSRGARVWSGGVPTELTSHTQLSEGRSAGLLHLKLNNKITGGKLEFYIPDLPGEWTTTLIDNNEAERFLFLKDADVIWITVDGRTLCDKKLRRGAMHRLHILFERVVGICGVGAQKYQIVVSRSDLGKPSDAIMEELANIGVSFSVAVEVNYIASFSLVDEVPAGHGISELLERSLTFRASNLELWPAEPNEAAKRHVLRIPPEDVA